MESKKVALFFFSDPSNAAYLANTLIKYGWLIKAPVNNVETLEKEGVDRRCLLPFFWGDFAPFIIPSERTILGIIGGNADRKMLKDKGIQRIDLVCADLIDIKISFKSVKQLRRAMSLERVKINLLMAAGEGGKIPICDPYDRKLFADWLNEGTGDIGRHCETKKRKKRKSRYSKTLRLMAAFALSLSREMMSVGTICDHLRE